MRQVNNSEVLRLLEDRAALGHHVDDRLLQAVKGPGALFLFTIEDEQSFLSLVWQEIDPTRLLTPSGRPRTLGDVAGRMIGNSWTFTSLSNSMGLPLMKHDPAAFRSFEAIDSAFDFSKFGFVAVMPASDSEKAPVAQWHILHL